MKYIRRAVFFIIILFSIIFRNSISFAWMESAWDNTDIDSLWLGEQIGEDNGDGTANNGVDYWAYDGSDYEGQMTLFGNTYDAGEDENGIIHKENIFCIQYGQELYLSLGVVKYIVKIEKDGVEINGQTRSYSEFDDDEIRKIFRMAYIMNDMGGRTRLVGSKSSYSDKQVAIWLNTGSFLKALDIDDLATTKDDKLEKLEENAPKTLLEQANMYAEKALKYIKNGSNLLKRNNEVDSVKLKDITYNGTEYIKVGPFNYSTTRDITNLTLVDENDNNINNLKFGSYNGNDFKVSDSYNDIIKSGEDFWILISKDRKINKIKKLFVSTEEDSFITSKLCYIEVRNNYQNAMTGYSDEEKMDNSDEMELNLDVTGSIEIKKIDTQSSKGIPNVKIQIKRNSDSKRVIGNLNGEVSYIDENESVPFGWYKEFTTGSDGKILIRGLYAGDYTITEIKNTNTAYVTNPNITVSAKIEPVKTTYITIDNQRIINLKIVKKDENSNAKLANVKFKIKRSSDGKFINKSSTGDITYVDENNATEFYTDINGEILIEGITVGKYVAIEMENPNKGYEKNPNTEFELDVNGNGNLSREIITKEITNKRKYIDLSGYIWKDMYQGKQTTRNDLYKDDNYDTTDEAFNGITVRLKDNDGNTLKETKSAEIGLYSEIDGGEYKFEDIEITKLGDYYIEFEYDGLIYQSVAININKNNGSKSTDKVEREILDKNFTIVNATGENKVDVNNKYTIGYTATQDHVAKINDSSSCTLHANTKDANYTITYTDADYREGKTEIRYINLGLYEKPQADLAIAHDLDNINVGVNGYWHIYKYGKRLNASGEIPDNSDSWNIGVKFKNRFTQTYNRAIYDADVNYQTEDKSKELQVYLTYKIAIRNESSYLTKANSVVDYFDNRYELVAAGTGIDGQNNITGNLSIASNGKYNDEYNKAIIDTNSVVKSGESNYIYVQYKLNREAVLQILNNKETLYSTVEINSYTVYKDNNGNTVAAIDRDSVPGNAKIENINTFEDDTDSAPSIQLELKDDRKITGIVFVDSTTGELKTGEIRQGNGQFDNGENTVSGVKVTLHELNNSIGDIETTTDANGNYEFTGYIPGQYTITYTWGDKDYKVQYYKGTVYDSSRDQNNKEWYKDAVDTRKTDAIDNYDERKAIDKEVANITNHTVGEEVSKAYNGEQSAITITKMNSVTPTMEFGVEYETTITDGTADKVEFIVKNVDFGIVERARQKLDLQKRVSTFKVTLANGQVLADAKVTEDGKLEGTTNHMTYMGPSTSGNGYVKLETDDELIEGATLNITYQIKAINQSEVDYMSENYYKYGIKEGNIATLTPSAVIDYLDKNLGFEDNDNKDESGNSIWQQISKVKLQEFKAQKVNDGGYLDNKKILYTDKIAKPIKPGDTKTVDLKVSKLLSSSTDMTFNNDAEVAKITSNDGQNPPVVPPTYPPVVSAEDSIVVPSTGANMNYAFPTIVGIVSLVILGIGVFVIKKKIIEK